MTDSRTFIHRIDGDGVIRFVNAEWLEFAVENEGGALSRDRVVGRPLYEFISGPETRHVYGLLYERVRKTGVGLEFPFRCDSPAARRFMTMRMSRFRDRWISFECRVDRVESRPPVALLDPCVDTSNDFLKVCSWCKRIDLASGDWQEAEIAVERRGLLSSPTVPQLTHGICPACVEKLRIARSLT